MHLSFQRASLGLKLSIIDVKVSDVHSLCLLLNIRIKCYCYASLCDVK